MLSLPAAAVSVTQAESNQNCSQHRAQRQRQHLGRYAGEGSKIAIITIRERNKDTEQSNTLPVLLLLLLLFVCFQYINSFTLSHSKVMTRSHVIQKEKKKKTARAATLPGTAALGFNALPRKEHSRFKKKKKGVITQAAVYNNIT